jgi:cytochrome bd-type quinol oxidase subunit 1
MPPALLRYRLAKEFGWTVEEIDRTPWSALNEILIAMEIEGKAARKRQASHRKRR